MDQGDELYEQALRYEATGELEKADSLFEQAREEYKESNNWGCVGRTYIHQARIRRDWGEFQEALVFIQKALEAFHKRARKVDPFGLAMLYNDWGNICNRLKSYDEAQKHYQRAIEFDKAFLATSPDKLRGLHGEEGSLDELEIQRRDCWVGLAITKLNLAWIFMDKACMKHADAYELINDLKALDKALSCIKEARDIALKLERDCDHSDSKKCNQHNYIMGEALSVWAGLEAFIAKNLWAAGGRNRERCPQRFPYNRADEADLRFNHAMILASDAIECLNKCNTQRQAYWGAVDLVQEWHERRIVQQWLEQGIVDKYPDYERIPLEKVYQRTPPWFKELDEVLEREAEGQVAGKAEDLSKVLSRDLMGSYESSIGRTSIQTLKMPVPVAWRILKHAAFIWQDSGWDDKAYNCLAKAVECIETMRRNLVWGKDPKELIEISDRIKTNFIRKEMQEIYERLIILLLSPYRDRIYSNKEDHTARAFHYCERAKARAFLDLLELSTTKDIDTKKITEQVGRVITLKELQGTLKEYAPNSLLLEYYLTDTLLVIFAIKADHAEVPVLTKYWGEDRHGYDPRKIVAKHVFDGSRIAELHVIVREFCQDIGHAVASEELQLTAEEWDSNWLFHVKKRIPKVQEFCRRKAFSTGNFDPFGFPLPYNCDLEEVKKQAKQLYNILIRPTEHLWLQNGKPNVERIIIVPHGILHQLPFCALFDGREFLVEKVSVVQTPSASTLWYCYRQRNRKAQQETADKESYLGIANPRGDENRYKKEWSEFSIIKQGEEGVSEALKYFDESRALIFIREDATWDNLLKYCTKYTIMYLATHGVHNYNDPLKSYILFRGRDGRPFLADILTLLRDLRFEQLKLLIAGFCFSGESRITLGDDLIGFIRAFFYAGAASILACRWALDDLAAEKFINKFFDGSEKGPIEGTSGLIKDGRMIISKDKALQNAQVYMIREGRENQRVTVPGLRAYLPTWEHPYYWAWMFIGDHC